MNLHISYKQAYKIIFYKWLIRNIDEILKLLLNTREEKLLGILSSEFFAETRYY